MRRKIDKKASEPADFVAYDLETTSIKAGTPTPLFITACAEHRDFVLCHKINGMAGLRDSLLDHFLVPSMNGVKFVAWGGNNYDVYFIALALLDCPQFILRPYLTKGKALRGLRVVMREDLERKPKHQRSWEFVDGIAVLGLVGTSLAKFLDVFAPDYKKIERRDSFDRREFDPNDSDDVRYAWRDSEGLYHGMVRAQNIMLEAFGFGLRTTIGNLGIRIFESRIPESIRIVEPPTAALEALRVYACRGGYCHLMRRYRGPVWKYDLNQAYAAAMRETKLPAGECRYLRGESKYCECSIGLVTAYKRGNIIPFYCRETADGKAKTVFATERITDSWLTSLEIKQLRAEGWTVKVSESWNWYDSFDMSDFVNALETLRASAEGGPSGASGTMIKAVGNNSYGKTLEQLDSVELVMSRECPPGFVDYAGTENPAPIPYIWSRTTDEQTKNYHQPQIAAFITAHVRMQVRRATLLAPESFLYADTDCVMFSKDMREQLDIDKKRYGAFKIEAEGDEYLLIAKKVYADIAFTVKHSKGLAVNSYF